MRIGYIILIAYLLVNGSGYLLEYLNLRRVKRPAHKIPPEFEGRIDPDFLEKTVDYLIENTRIGAVYSILSNAVTVFFIFGPPLERYNSWVSSLNLPFMVSGLAFFLFLFYAGLILSIPFGLYRAFKIEKRFGFNTMTPGLWAVDALKSALISTFFVGLAISAALWAVEKSPGFWWLWLWLWLFFLLFSLFMMYISPYVIGPLFNKFERIEDRPLEDRIKRLMDKAGLEVTRIFKVDASKRTRHTNAYFTGIGKAKRIVLYDTLLEKLNEDEVVSVLAHEAGHWKKKHILKNAALTQCLALAAMYASFRLLQGDLLNEAFNITGGGFFTKVFILGFIGAVVTFPLEPLLNYISRRHEFEADIYACELTGGAEDFKSALVKLSKDNLSNLDPHPLYAAFHYSHPPVIERIRHMAG